MKSMVKYLLIFCASAITLNAVPSKQVLQLSICDEERLNTQMPRTPNFMRSGNDTGVERGYMALYEHVLLETMGTFSVHFGGNVARWTGANDQVTTGSAFLSGRMWILHLLFIHPYVEYSIFGPTLISKESFGDLKFGSNFLYQNFFGIGVDVGNGRGFNIDLKTIRYYEATNFQPHEGFRVPVIASVGVLF